MPKKAAAPKPEPNQTPPVAPAPEPALTAPPDGAAPPADAPPSAPAPAATPPAEPDAPGAEQVLQEDAAASKAEPPAAALSQEPVPDLDDFITTHEKAAQAVDLVVTAISYPGAQARHHHGVYSGFPIAAGELQATYSDGSKH